MTEMPPEKDKGVAGLKRAQKEPSTEQPLAKRAKADNLPEKATKPPTANQDAADPPPQRPQKTTRTTPTTGVAQGSQMRGTKRGTNANE